MCRSSYGPHDKGPKTLLRQSHHGADGRLDADAFVGVEGLRRAGGHAVQNGELPTVFAARVS
jgi:hypothetical protein